VKRGPRCTGAFEKWRACHLDRHRALETSIGASSVLPCRKRLVTSDEAEGRPRGSCTPYHRYMRTSTKNRKYGSRASRETRGWHRVELTQAVMRRQGSQAFRKEDEKLKVRQGSLTARFSTRTRSRKLARCQARTSSARCCSDVPSAAPAVRRALAGPHPELRLRPGAKERRTSRRLACRHPRPNSAKSSHLRRAHRLDKRIFTENPNARDYTYAVSITSRTCRYPDCRADQDPRGQVGVTGRSGLPWLRPGRRRCSARRRGQTSSPSSSRKPARTRSRHQVVGDHRLGSKAKTSSKTPEAPQGGRREGRGRGVKKKLEDAGAKVELK